LHYLTFLLVVVLSSGLSAASMIFEQPAKMKQSWDVQWKGELVLSNASLALSTLVEEVYQAEGSPAEQKAVVRMPLFFWNPFQTFLYHRNCVQVAKHGAHLCVSKNFGSIC
jgi:hypothetical protein